MTVLEIVRKYLTDNGYNGLYSKDDECGCSLDDLSPCNDEECFRECIPAYEHISESGDSIFSPNKQEK